MKKIKQLVKDNLNLAILAATALVLLALLIFTDILLAAQEARENIPSPVVLEFLEKYIPMRSSLEREECLNTYFSSINATTIDHDGESQTQRDFNSVFWVNQGNAVSYRLCSASKHYVEFMLLNAEGKDLPCRIGLYYTVGSDGKIARYSIMRLLPVSKKDSEWSEVWYG